MKKLLTIILTIVLISICLTPVSAKIIGLKVCNKVCTENIVLSKDSSGVVGDCIKDGTIEVVINEDKSATLLLTNLKLECESNLDNIIYSNFPLEIKLVGNNSINASNVQSVIVSGANLTFSGSGKLVIDERGTKIEPLVEEEPIIYEGIGAIFSAGNITFNLSPGGKVEAKTSDYQTKLLYESPMAILIASVAEEEVSGDLPIYKPSSKTIKLMNNNVIVKPENNELFDLYTNPVQVDEGDPKVLCINTIVDSLNDKEPATHVIIENKKVEGKSEPKDETCEAVIGPNWTWDEELGVCKEVVRNKVGYKIVNTATY